MSVPRRWLRWEELEQAARIGRNVPRSATRGDAARIERKILGRSWGRKRRRLS